MNEKTTILYVDDEPFNLLLFKRLFKDRYDVMTSESGLEGMEVLRSENTIKAVISDLKMPSMDGIEFVTKAKKEFPNVAFFLLTGFDCTPEITEILEKKIIFNYFGKPLNINHITSSIEKSLV